MKDMQTETDEVEQELLSHPASFQVPKCWQVAKKKKVLSEDYRTKLKY